MKVIDLPATESSHRATPGGPLVIATCNDWPDPSRSDAAYLHALEARGVQVQHAPWDGESRPFLTARAVILRSTWNYHHDLPRFRRWLSLLEAAGVPVWNPPALVRWNLDKRYLLELGRLGIPVVPTVALDTPSAEGVAAVMGERGWSEAVVKPVWGASGFAVRRVHLSEFTGNPPDLGMPDRPHLVQEYLPAVSDRGEVGLVYFAGTFSHALLKRPSAGEFRVNSQYGGSVTAMEATEGLQTAAARVIAALPSSPLYARVDGVVTDRGFVVMEVELIEPGLWMDRADGAAGRFADATLAALAGGSGALPDAYAAVEIRADAP